MNIQFKLPSKKVLTFAIFFLSFSLANFLCIFFFTSIYSKYNTFEDIIPPQSILQESQVFNSPNYVQCKASIHHSTEIPPSCLNYSREFYQFFTEHVISKSYLAKLNIPLSLFKNEKKYVEYISSIDIYDVKEKLNRDQKELNRTLALFIIESRAFKFLYTKY